MIESPEEEGGQKKLFEIIMAKFVANKRRVQTKKYKPNDPRILMNPKTGSKKKTTSRYIIIKLLKISEKENISKADSWWGVGGK